MKRLFTFVTVIVGIASGNGTIMAGEVTLETLLTEMISRDSVAVYPEPSYICRQFSSYDRDTKEVDGPGWYANWDRSQFVRMEEVDGRQEWVMLDADGPGAIVRFWGTWHGSRGKEFSNGTLRVYLDKSPKPVIEGPIADIISGGKLVGAPPCRNLFHRKPTTKNAGTIFIFRFLMSSIARLLIQQRRL